MSKKDNVHFRVHTMKLLNEIADNALTMGQMGVFKVPLNVLRDQLLQMAQRCTELNDPILDRICFDMALYELPDPSIKEYGQIMRKIYKAEKDFLAKKKQPLRKDQPNNY